VPCLKPHVCACVWLQADGAVLVNVTARRIKAGRGAVIYNVVDDSEVCVCVRMCAGGVLLSVDRPL
jgi:hypothetical protein